MCTAITYQTDDFYFGRNLDYDRLPGEKVALMPRKFLSPEHPFAVLGMAHIADDYPLFYDAVNEKGLCMAGLNFPGNAVFAPAEHGAHDIAQYELMPTLLARCADVSEAKSFLKSIRLTDKPFSPAFPASDLHWMIADKNACITVEATASGLEIFDNPAGVLTNNPPFEMQLFGLNNYRALSPDTPPNTFGLPLQVYSRGMGAMGLPGDLSSASRFVRAAFVRANAVSEKGENASVQQFFHLLSAVEQPRGCCRLENGGLEYTLYSACCNATRGIYYYKTYESAQIIGIDMHREDLNSRSLIVFPLQTVPPLIAN